MHILYWMCSNTKRNKLRNDNIIANVGVALIEKKM